MKESEGKREKFNWLCFLFNHVIEANVAYGIREDNLILDQFTASLKRRERVCSSEDVQKACGCVICAWENIKTECELDGWAGGWIDLDVCVWLEV